MAIIYLLIRREYVMKDMYNKLGISNEVIAYSDRILESLKDRFAAIDENAAIRLLFVFIPIPPNPLY